MSRVETQHALICSCSLIGPSIAFEDFSEPDQTFEVVRIQRQHVDQHIECFASAAAALLELDERESSIAVAGDDFECRTKLARRLIEAAFSHVNAAKARACRNSELVELDRRPQCFFSTP